MDARIQAVLAEQLHRTLIGHMGSVSRLVFIMSGQEIDPMSLVEAMERDLRKEIALIGTVPTRYSDAELRVRTDIAQRVVASIRADVIARV